MGILDNEEIREFEESRMSFMASLLEAELSDMEEIEYDEEDDSVSATGELSANILENTLSYDFSLLSELRDTELNKNTNNDLFKIFMGKLEQNALDFYGYLGSSLGDDYAESFELFDEDEEENEDEIE